MDAPVKDLEKIKTLLDLGQKKMEIKAWDEAEAAFNEALNLDVFDPRAYGNMAEMFREKGDEKLAEQWQARADQVRKEHWKRQVEAEARGHHEMLGEALRHEIP